MSSMFCLYILLQLAEQFGPLPQRGSNLTVPRRSSSVRAKTSGVGAKRKRKSVDTSSNVPGPSTVEQSSFEEMADRLDKRIDELLHGTDVQSQQRLAFNHFIGTCLPSICDEVWPTYYGNVAEYTAKCVQLSREIAAHKAQATLAQENQPQMPSHGSSGVPGAQPPTSGLAYQGTSQP